MCRYIRHYSQCSECNRHKYGKFLSYTITYAVQLIVAADTQIVALNTAMEAIQKQEAAADPVTTKSILNLRIPFPLISGPQLTQSIHPQLRSIAKSVN